MIRWTEGQALSEEPADRSPLRRLRGTLDEHAVALGSALGFARGFLVVAGVVGVLLAAVPFVDRSNDTAASVKAPTFAKLPTIVQSSERQESAPARNPPATGGDSGRRYASPAFDYVQSFSSREDTPQVFCANLVSDGFKRAKWAPSEVFKGEWECSSLLALGGKNEGTAFLAVRGSQKDAVRSMMLKVNPSSPEDQAVLAGKAAGILENFSAAFGVLLPAQVYEWTVAGETGQILTSFGRARVIAERGRQERRIFSLSVEETLPRPSQPCPGECRSWRVLDTAASRQVPERLARR